MAILPDARRYVLQQVARGVANSEKKTAAEIANRTWRQASFTLNNIAVGTQVVEVEWNVPIGGPYTIVATVTCAAAAVGLLTIGLQAGSKTATGCSVIVANRTAGVIGAAAFDVLAFPL